MKYDHRGAYRAYLARAMYTEDRQANVMRML